MRKYTTGLSASGFRTLAKEIRKYRNGLQEKCEEFAKRLCEEGMECTKIILSQHKDSRQTLESLHLEDYSLGNKAYMCIVVESEAILFLEFGAGIKYSHTQNPKASELGYGAGTYPGKGHWDDPDGWYYIKDGKWHHTFGTEASMPMYNTSVEMRDKVQRIANEVFSS